MTERIGYGPDPAQWAELHRPTAGSRGVVVVVHGGFWKAAYDASLGTPLAVDLAARGWTALNVEYRRVGGGGGCPATLDDVAAAIESLPADVDRSVVVTLGHSAGGQLAAWAAARGRYGWPDSVRVTHVMSQAGVLDLDAAVRDGLGSGAAAAFLGAEIRPERVDPTRQLPLEVPVWCVHARDDDVVPFSQSEQYVARARAGGGTAELVEVTGGHFGVIDPASSAWLAQLAVLDRIAPLPGERLRGEPCRGD